MNKKTELRKQRDDLRTEYDLRKLKSGVRGKYAARYKAGTNLVLLSPDVAEHFPDDRSVNSALRKLIRVAKRDPARKNSTTDSEKQRLGVFSRSAKESHGGSAQYPFALKINSTSPNFQLCSVPVSTRRKRRATPPIEDEYGRPEFIPVMCNIYP